MTETIEFLERGYTLPSGCSWEPTIVDGKKEGITEVCSMDGIMVASLTFSNDMLNGLCEFYKEGILVKKIMYVDDVPNGWGYEIDDDDNETRFFYENGEKRIMLKKNTKNGKYLDEIDLLSNRIVSSCEYNEKSEKHGLGYLFNDNVISKVVVFENGKEGRLVKEFRNGEMIEFDEEGARIYKGGYLDSFEKEYPREGQGKEYYENVLVYKGEWKDGKKNGKGLSLYDCLAYYNGTWKDNLPEGEGCLYDHGYFVCKGSDWVKGVLKVDGGKVVTYDASINEKMKIVVKKEKDWKDLPKTVKELIVDENTCNNMMNNLVIEEFKYLKSILVKKGSMMHLKSLKICNCQLLESIEIEQGDNGCLDANNVEFSGLCFSF